MARRVKFMKPGAFYDAVMAVLRDKYGIGDQDRERILYTHYSGSNHGTFYLAPITLPLDQEGKVEMITSIDALDVGVECAAQHVMLRLTGTAIHPDRGTPIPGSVYFRNYCCGCQTPIRVIEKQKDYVNLYCEQCSGKTGKQQRGEHITPRQGHGMIKTNA